MVLATAACRRPDETSSRVGIAQKARLGRVLPTELDDLFKYVRDNRHNPVEKSRAKLKT
ncbi:TPA: hypothetical protein ACH3X1_011505 [Trebouxia sp. C0004]